MSDSPPDPFAFTPVPSASRRHDGWTPERQRAFIAALSKIGVIATAAKSVGMSRKSAYALLERAGPESSFAHAWSEAQAAGRTTVWFTAVERAIDGVEVPYFYRGIQRGTKRVYNERLLITALRAIDRAQGSRSGLSSRSCSRLAEPRTRRTGTFVTFATFALSLILIGLLTTMAPFPSS